MNNTPSSRTSKHGTARKRNNRKTLQHQQQHSLVQAPVTTFPDRAAMEPPPAQETRTVDDDEKREFVVDSPQFDLLQIREEDEIGEFVQETSQPVSGDPSIDESGARAEWLGPKDNAVDLTFNPFAAIDDADSSLQSSASPYELRAETMPQTEPGEPATLRVGDYGETEEQAEPSYGGPSDNVEGARSKELERIEERPSGVTSLNSPPASPPPRGSGRTRAPILVSRNPTSPSSLSRQLQNVQALLPTSPQLGFSSPFANFAAPRISNVTVSGSSFHHNPISRPSPDTFVSTKEARRRSTGNFGETKDRDRARLRMTPTMSKSSDSDEEDDMPSSSVTKYTRYPTSPAGNDKVIYASFANVSYPLPSSPKRRLLFVGYENGLQIWDITHLGEVREVLSRRISGSVVGCTVLPSPRIVTIGRGRSVDDGFSSLRPLIGVVVDEHNASYLLVYSLATHEVVKKLDFSGATVTSTQAGDSFIVVSTSSPFSLHILCSRTLNILHTIQARQLSIFSRPVSLRTSEGSVETVYSARQDRPHAIFALSSRLLAFASVPPSSESPSITNIYPHMAVPHEPSIQLGSLNVTQADIGNAALKVGGGLLSGMKTLGGIAVAAARGERSNTMSSDSGGLRKFFSRSAPVASAGTRHVRSPSDHSQSRGDSAQSSTPTQARSSTLIDSGHITVLDLQPLLDDRENGRPERLSDFSIPSGQVVARLKFSEDGTNLSAVPDDGGTVRFYQIKPSSRILRDSSLNRSVQGTRDKLGQDRTRKDSSGSVETRATPEASEVTTAWHIYDLRRGRTSGIIEAVDHSMDGRWIGISTRKRTIHVFATNPYGGKPDNASHTEGRVKNVDEIQPLSTEVRPIVRLRSNPVSSPEQLAIPLAFIFISPSHDSLPTKFLPPPNTFSPPSSVSSSIPSSVPHRRTQSVSPRLPSRPTNYHDILVFDPSEGSLSLRRMTISSRIGETGTFLASLPIPTGTSISLPGMGFMGRPSASPPKSTVSSSTPTGTEHLQTELIGKDSTIATWNLMRDSKWSEVKEPLITGHEHLEQRRSLPKSEWLAQAELSTCSRSTRIVPGSIYLSHQFSFFAFSEDYHALIRRLHFEIPVDKIEVRRQVEASAYVAGQGESFVSAASTPQDVRGARSFDEPLASAIDTGLEYSGSSLPIIPMLPNGARPGSFKAAIPIRSVAANLTEGVNESIVRLSRGFRRVRSPRMAPARTDESVPLEFDEEDEAFLSEHGNDNDNDTMSNSGCGRDSHSVSTPSTNNNMPLPENESEQDQESGWLDDMDAVEEVERFDEINAARLMEEESMQQAAIRVPQKPRALRKGGRGM